MQSDQPLTRKKVLFLITKSNFGGAQRYVYDLATNLPNDTYETAVALGGNGPLCEKLQKKGIRVIQLESLKRDIAFTKEVQTVFELTNLLRREKPDVFHINSSKAGGLGALIGRLCGVKKIVFTAHGWAFNENRSRLAKFVIKILHWLTVLMAHKTIAVSEAIDKQMDWKLPKNKIAVIHNGRQTPDFLERTAARSELINKCPALAPYQDDFWSVTIAELHPIKQHRITIDSINKIIKQDPNIRHLIIGGGELETELKTQIKKLGLDNNVFLLGLVDEAAQYLRAFDLFVLASRSEALAYVLIEACLAKLPVIASNVGGLPEILGTAGVLVPSGDHDELASAYQDLLHDKEKRVSLSEAAAQRSSKFSIEQMIANTTHLYT